LMDPPAPVVHQRLNGLVCWATRRSLTEGHDIHCWVDRVNGGCLKVAGQGVHIRYRRSVQSARDSIQVVSVESDMASACRSVQFRRSSVEQPRRLSDSQASTAAAESDRLIGDLNGSA